MRTELHRSPCSAAPLARLTERLAAMAVPCPMHPSVHQIEAAVLDWSREVGLDADPGAGAHRLAGRAFARHDTGTATLFARWLTWMSHFRKEPSALAGVIGVARGGEPGPPPLEQAFADLWRTCAPRMSDGWRERFLSGLTAQHAALLATRTLTPGALPTETLTPGALPTEALATRTFTLGALPAEALPTGAIPAGPLRDGTPLPRGALTGETPSIEDYPPLGRNAFGRYLFDLVEPCTGVEVPTRIQENRHWRAIVEASGDVVAWCGDVATGRGYVTIASARLDRRGEAAVEWVIDRVVARMEELWTAARTISVLVERYDLGFTASREVIQVACAFLTIPRAYLEWLLESRPYDVR